MRVLRTFNRSAICTVLMVLLASLFACNENKAKSLVLKHNFSTTTNKEIAALYSADQINEDKQVSTSNSITSVEANYLPFPKFAGAGLIYMNNKIIYFGGCNGDVYSGKSVKFNDTVYESLDGKKWNKFYSNNLLPSRCFFSTTFFHGKYWLLGGISNYDENHSQFGSLNYGLNNDIYSFDGNDFIKESKLPYNIFEHISFVSDDKLCIFGGKQTLDEQSSSTLYCSLDGRSWDLETKSTIAIRGIPANKITPSNSMINSENFSIYISRDETNNNSAKITYLYSPQKTLELKRNDISLSKFHSSVLFENKILILGGETLNPNTDKENPQIDKNVSYIIETQQNN